MRCATDSYKNALGSQDTITDRYRIGPGQFRPAGDQVGTRIFQQPPVNRFKPVQFGVLCRNQLRPVMPVNTDLPAVTGRISGISRKGRSIHQQLFRHATTDDAGPAGAIPLNHRDARTMTGRHAGRAYTAGTGANDNQIIIIFHDECFPDCGADKAGQHRRCPRSFIP